MWHTAERQAHPPWPGGRTPTAGTPGCGPRSGAAPGAARPVVRVGPESFKAQLATRLSGHDLSLSPALASGKPFIQPIKDDVVGQAEVVELAVGVSPFGDGEPVQLLGAGNAL